MPSSLVLFLMVVILDISTNSRLLDVVEDGDTIKDVDAIKDVAVGEVEIHRIAIYSIGDLKTSNIPMRNGTISHMAKDKL
jgi:hypothetical protein